MAATTILAILGSRNQTGPNAASSSSRSMNQNRFPSFKFWVLRHASTIAADSDPDNRQVTNRFFPSGGQCGGLRSQ
jgi:hypothetical protein